MRQMGTKTLLLWAYLLCGSVYAQNKIKEDNPYRFFYMDFMGGGKQIFSPNSTFVSWFQNRLNRQENNKAEYMAWKVLFGRKIFTGMTIQMNIGDNSSNIFYGVVGGYQWRVSNRFKVLFPLQLMRGSYQITFPDSLPAPTEWQQLYPNKDNFLRKLSLETRFSCQPIFQLIRWEKHDIALTIGGEIGVTQNILQGRWRYGYETSESSPVPGSLISVRTTRFTGTKIPEIPKTFKNSFFMGLSIGFISL